MLYLGCPNILNLQQMIDNGIFISDMSSHDLSRNIMFSNVEKHIEQCLMKNLEENSKDKLENIADKFSKTVKMNKARRSAWTPTLVIPLGLNSGIKISSWNYRF